MGALPMVVNIVEIVFLLAAFASGIAVATLIGMSQVSMNSVLYIYDV